MEDNKTFSSLSFSKSKYKNKLNEHLLIVMAIFS